MAEPAQAQETAPEKKSKFPLMIGLAMMLVLGSGGFFAVYSGMLLAPASSALNSASTDGHTSSGRKDDDEILPLPPIAFVPLDPLVINLGTGRNSQRLLFRAQLEVVPEYESEVIAILPRVLDVFNGYLRAISLDDIQDPAALTKIRAQMLRRVKIVTGEGRVRDLLIMEFVVN